MKYRLTEETLEVRGHILHRIVALKDFSNVKKGDLGGFIEKEINLSQEGNCWIYDEAAVYNSAEVRDDAIVRNYADISDAVMVFGNAKVHNHVRIWDNARVYGNAAIYGNTKIYNYAEVGGDANVSDDVRIFNSAVVLDHVTVYGCAKVGKNAAVYGNAVIKGNAVIESRSDYIVFKNWWSSGRYFTWTRSNDMWSVGCFYGTGQELIRRAYADNSRSGREYAKIVKYVEMIKQELK